MKKKAMRTMGLIVLFVSGVCSAPTMAADYPTKPIKMMVGFKAGGGVDTMARMVAKILSAELGKPVVVQNRPGGGGNLMCSQLYKADPDGYTLGVAPSTVFAFNPLAMKTKYKTSDFDYLGMNARFQDVFVANTEKPWRDMKEMLAWAKEKGEKLRYASVSPLDMAIAKAISAKSGVPILPMPTKGTTESLTNILGGHVDFGFSAGPHYSYVKAGKMFVLVGLSSDPPVAFPDVKTLNDLGYDLAMEDYLAVVAPKGLPSDVAARIEESLKKAFTNDQFLKIVDDMHFEAKYKNRQESQAVMDDLVANMKKIID